MDDAETLLNDASLDDVVIPFQIADTAVRGRLVRLGPTIDEILRRHGYPAALSELVAEVATLTAMLGASLKHEGKLTLQLRSDGPVSLLVADVTAAGGVRACATIGQEFADRIDAYDKDELLGEGHLALTLDQGADMDRYQGVVDLAGGSLEVAALKYFQQSEQIPTALKLVVGRVYEKGKGEVWRAGGVMVQHVPAEGGARARGEAEALQQSDLDDWARAEALLETTEPDELLDPSLPPARLLYRLYHEDGVRVYDPRPLVFECACSQEKVENVLARYPQEELKSMEQGGAIRVTCDFCSRSYETSAARIAEKCQAGAEA